MNISGQPMITNCQLRSGIHASGATPGQRCILSFLRSSQIRISALQLLLVPLTVSTVFPAQLNYSNKDWTWTKNQCNSAYKR